MEHESEFRAGPHRVSAPREAVEMKPPHGSPCNRCGLCCAVALCDLAQHAFDRLAMPGPCPALLGGIGSASCGLVEDPARFAPMIAAKRGVDALRSAAKRLINAGHGCDMRINGELPNRAYVAAMDQHDEEHEDELAAARDAWSPELTIAEQIVGLGGSLPKRSPWDTGDDGLRAKLDEMRDEVRRVVCAEQERRDEAPFMRLARAL